MVYVSLKAKFDGHLTIIIKLNMLNTWILWEWSGPKASHSNLLSNFLSKYDTFQLVSAIRLLPKVSFLVIFEIVFKLQFH